MQSNEVNLQQVLDAIEKLRENVSGLSERVGMLEANASAATPAESEDMSEELVMTISAAIAAYLGVKPQIRQIRLLGNASWARRGRATIQASHSVSLHHG